MLTAAACCWARVCLDLQHWELATRDIEAMLAAKEQREVLSRTGETAKVVSCLSCCVVDCAQTAPLLCQRRSDCQWGSHACTGSYGARAVACCVQHAATMTAAMHASCPPLQQDDAPPVITANIAWDLSEQRQQETQDAIAEFRVLIKQAVDRGDRLEQQLQAKDQWKATMRAVLCKLQERESLTHQLAKLASALSRFGASIHADIAPAVPKTLTLLVRGFTMHLAIWGHCSSVLLENATALPRTRPCATATEFAAT